jgi:hypothetical protein
MWVGWNKIYLGEVNDTQYMNERRVWDDESRGGGGECTHFDGVEV